MSTVGIPSHSVSGASKEFRCLKGNVTFVSKLLELSFPAPRGMGGSPIFRGASVVGVLSWNARAEALEDQSEETTERIGNITRVSKTVTMAVTNYGLAEPLHAIRDAVYPFSEEAPFSDFVARLNA